MVDLDTFPVVCLSLLSLPPSAAGRESCLSTLGTPSAGSQARAPRCPATALSLIFHTFSRDPSPLFSVVRVDICSPCAFTSPSVYPMGSADTPCCQVQALPFPRAPSVQGTIAHSLFEAASCRIQRASPGGGRSKPDQSPPAYLEQE